MTVLALAALAATARPLAVVVGHNGAPAGEALSPLQFTDDDALRGRLLLEAWVEPSDIRVLADPSPDIATLFPEPPGPPTWSALEAAVNDLAASAGDEPREWILVLSAHGRPGEVYLEGGSVDLSLVRALVQPRPGTGDSVLLVVDACQTGFESLPKAPYEHEPYDLRTRQKLLRKRDIAWVHPGASRWTELAVQSRTPELAGTRGVGLFSYLALSAVFVGAADLDGDGAVTPHEVVDFLDALAAGGDLTGQRFVPRISAADPEASIARGRPTSGTTLTVGGEGAARWEIYLPGGTFRLAEAFSTDRALTLTLPPGDYEVREYPFRLAVDGRSYVFDGPDDEISWLDWMGGWFGLSAPARATHAHRHHVRLGEDPVVLRDRPLLTPLPSPSKGDGAGAAWIEEIPLPPRHDASGGGVVVAADRRFRGLAGGVGAERSTTPMGGVVLRLPAAASPAAWTSLEAGVATETGDPATARTSTGRIVATRESRLHGPADGRIASLSVSAGLGVEVAVVSTEDLVAVAAGPLLRAAATVTLWPGEASGVRITVGADVPAYLVDADDPAAIPVSWYVVPSPVVEIGIQALRTPSRRHY